MKNKLNRCLLISLGAFGNDNLIPNGPVFEKNIKIFYKKISILSSDKYYFYPRLLRKIFYLKDIFSKLFAFKEEDIFIHMNTQFALPIILSPFRRKGKIITWYSHRKISWITNFVLKKSDLIITGSPEVIKNFPNSIFSHGIIIPSKRNILRCKLKKNSNRDLIFLGRFSSIKRLDLFVEVAIKAFNLKLINGVRIKATSHEKNVEKKVINKLEESKIPLKIYKDKKSSDIYSFFKSGDIYLNMQSQCGVGKAMLEACAVGVEVIVACEELKYLINNIDKRTVNNSDKINSAIKIIEEVCKTDYIYSNNEASLRIKDASNYSVFNLVKNAIAIAYS